jgi:hypothetical protein
VLIHLVVVLFYANIVVLVHCVLVPILLVVVQFHVVTRTSNVSHEQLNIAVSTHTHTHTAHLLATEADRKLEKLAILRNYGVRFLGNFSMVE